MATAEPLSLKHQTSECSQSLEFVSMKKLYKCSYASHYHFPGMAAASYSVLGLEMQFQWRAIGIVFICYILISTKQKVPLKQVNLRFFLKLFNNSFVNLLLILSIKSLAVVSVVCQQICEICFTILILSVGLGLPHLRSSPEPSIAQNPRHKNKMSSDRNLTFTNFFTETNIERDSRHGFCWYLVWRMVLMRKAEEIVVTSGVLRDMTQL